MTEDAKREARRQNAQRAAKQLLKTLTDEDYEAMRLAVEDELIDRRDRRISVLRNNGLVCKERSGLDSWVIRLSTEEAIQIALRRLAETQDLGARTQAVTRG